MLCVYSSIQPVPEIALLLLCSVILMQLKFTFKESETQYALSDTTPMTLYRIGSCMQGNVIFFVAH